MVHDNGDDVSEGDWGGGEHEHVSTHVVRDMLS